MIWNGDCSIDGCDREAIDSSGLCKKHKRENTDTWEPLGTYMPYRNLIEKIKEEAMKPTCMSLDVDPTPTGEERLKKIVKMIRRFEKEK